MSALSATLAGRAAAEALMSDACIVRRLTGKSLDQASLQYADTYATVYDGACRVRSATARGANHEVEAGERTVTLREYIVSLPVAVEGLAVSDVVEVTASVLDPELVGTRMRVLGPAKGSTITARRFPCEEMTT